MMEKTTNSFIVFTLLTIIMFILYLAVNITNAISENSIIVAASEAGDNHFTKMLSGYMKQERYKEVNTLLFVDSNSISIGAYFTRQVNENCLNLIISNKSNSLILIPEMAFVKLTAEPFSLGNECLDEWLVKPLDTFDRVAELSPGQSLAFTNVLESSSTTEQCSIILYYSGFQIEEMNTTSIVVRHPIISTIHVKQESQMGGGNTKGSNAKD